jgi:hypothetical protein
LAGTIADSVTGLKSFDDTVTSVTEKRWTRLEIEDTLYPERTSCGRWPCGQGWFGTLILREEPELGGYIKNRWEIPYCS